MSTALEMANKLDAFLSAIPIATGRVRLYVQQTDLYNGVVTSLESQSALKSANGLRGVLIHGNHGMGKSTLAKDIALSFRNEAGECVNQR